MAKAPSLVIDIGGKRIKAMLVKASKGGAEVVKADSEALDTAAKVDSEEFYQKIREILPLLLQRMGAKKEKRAIVTIPGRAAFTRQIRIPVVRGRQLGRIIKYEAKQQIPFPLDQVNLDYRVNQTNPENNELEVTLVAVRREVANSYADVLKKCGIRADIIEAAPLSMYNAYAASPLRDADEVTALVSIGASGTDIVIEQGGEMQFMRSAPVAGNTLTGLIAKKCGIPAEDAEELKKKPAEAFTGNEPASAEDVASVLESGFEQIVTEIRRSFDFYVSQPDAQPVTRVLLSGGTVNVQGVTDFLEDRLGVPVSLFNASETGVVTIPDEYREKLDKEAPLVGMAVRAAGLSACALSFSPPHIKQKLELERRAPALSMMAVLVVLMIAGSAFFLQTLVDKQAQALAQMNEIISPGVEAQPELRDERTVQEAYSKRFERINQIVEKRGYLTRIFLEVQRLIPQDIWLESIEQTSGRMTLVGSALNQEAISAYMQNLSMSPYFNSNAVALTDTSFEANPTLNRTQIEFTISILEYNDPTETEIQFVEEFRQLTKGIPILIVEIRRQNEEDPESDATVVVGLYDYETMEERVGFLNKVYTALENSGDQTVKTIDLRFHDRDSNLVNHYTIPREQVKAFLDRQLTMEDFVKEFKMLTPEPTPEPTPTPTPGEEEGGDAAGGMYGMGMYGMGMYGMGMPMGGGAGGGG